MRRMENPVEFVHWLRSVAPYIHAFRGKTFVVAFPGELVKPPAPCRCWPTICPCCTRWASMLRWCYGSRPQVAEQLALRNVEGRFHNGIRITDTAAMECAKEAAGELRLDIEAAFSQGLPNTPMSHAAIRIISGNFVTARPLGVIDGVDLELTGVTRKVACRNHPLHPRPDGLVLLSPLGFSPTGEAFNLTMEDVACSAAIALHADKLIFITETEMMTDWAAPKSANCPRTRPKPCCSRLPAARRAFYLRMRSRPATMACRAPTSCRSRWTARPCWNCSPTMAWAP
jgi:amino-acid N-acetyltransferase